MAHDLRDVAEGLWIWRVDHPDWTPDAEFSPPVTSTCAVSGGEVALLDPLAPPEDARDVWERLDERPPTMVVVLKPDHVRDVDLFARRYARERTGRGCSGAPTFRRPSSSRSSPGACCPAGSSRSTTAAAGWRRRSGCRSNGRSSSPTR